MSTPAKIYCSCVEYFSWVNSITSSNDWGGQDGNYRGDSCGIGYLGVRFLKCASSGGLFGVTLKNRQISANFGRFGYNNLYSSWVGDSKWFGVRQFIPNAPKQICSSGPQNQGRSFFNFSVKWAEGKKIVNVTTVKFEAPRKYRNSFQFCKWAWSIALTLEWEETQFCTLKWKPR